ncbi:hypothetical protein NQZ68_013967 [Dissostichus eleginoides]|nr:hypothetical protein NQZ68_013967 [Dissostichus eleginoides]
MPVCYLSHVLQRRENSYSPLDEMLILGEFLSGPRVAGPRPGKGLTFLGKRTSTMLLEGWSGFFSTPVDSAHVDYIHRMSVN